MEILYIELHPSSNTSVELRYKSLMGKGYKLQILQLSEIQELIALAERDIYTSLPDPVAMGKKLFAWLDGTGRWLSRALETCREEVLVLAIANLAKLPHLPWEVLHDREGFLIDRTYPQVVPVRWVKAELDAQRLQPADRPLRVMFMATDPEGVEPRLDFEKEEGRILDATRALNLTLRVEESGCVSELKKTWRRYGENHFDVFHLTGHAAIAEDGEPFFVTESETGDRHDAKAREIAEALRFRLPRLVFLSGCRTGQAGKEGVVPSMAEALLDLGLTAVLGWGRPIGDDAATKAAACLYEALAAGLSLVAAIATTYQKLREAKVANWYLLRLYGRGDLAVSLEALVEPMGDRLPMISDIEQLFLDPNDATTPRVVRREDFVGRRRILQTCLRRLAGSDLGILLHGMGGLGKTTIAKRLLERIADPQASNYDTIFIYKQLDEDKLVRELSGQCESELGHEILNGKLPLMQRLTKFLKDGLNQSDRRFMFVLDDFEENLEDVDGAWVLKPQVVQPLMALVEAIARSGMPHKLIVTCRYDFTLPDLRLNARLLRVPVQGLRGADLKKKCDRLMVFQPPVVEQGASVTEQEAAERLVSLQKRAIEVADGNPRLLEWLAAILPVDVLTEAQKLEILDAMKVKKAEFRENILAQELLDRQSRDLWWMLARGLVFDLPVPEVAFVKVCEVVENLKSHQNRAVAIGLLEVNGDLYRVPKILVELLAPEFSQELYATAVRELDRVWWESDYKISEDEMLEIHRLAIFGDEKEIAVTIGSSLAISWNNHGRFREAVRLCETTLKISKSYHIYHALARSQGVLGEVNLAKNNYQKALALFPNEKITTDDQSEKAAIIHNLAGIYAQQGNIKQAINLYYQSLDLAESIGSMEGKAATLNQIGKLKLLQGNIDEALVLHLKSLEICRANDLFQSEASALHAIAVIHDQQGKLSQALSFYQQSLAIKERIDDVMGQDATLHCIAGIYLQQGRLQQALSFYQQSLRIQDRIGNAKGKAATYYEIAGIYAQQGHMEQALLFCQQSLEITDHIDDIQGKATALALIGTICYNHGRIEDGLEFSIQAKEYFDEIGDLRGQGSVIHNIATIHAKQGNLDKVLILYQESIKIDEQLKNIQGKAATLHCMAIIYAQQRKLAQAINLFKQSLEIKERTGGDIHGKAITLWWLGGLAKEQGDFQDAISYLQESLVILQHLKSPDAATVQQMLEQVQQMTQP